MPEVFTVLVHQRHPGWTLDLYDDGSTHLRRPQYWGPSRWPLDTVVADRIRSERGGDWMPAPPPVPGHPGPFNKVRER